MRDRRVRQHPLHVGLGEPEDRADRHRDDRDHPDHRPPVPPGGGEGDVEHPQDRAERRHLRAGRHQRGHRRRRALVDVRRPGVERRRAGLEQQPDQQQREAEEEQQVVLLAAGRRLQDLRQVDRVGVAVQQGDAVQEERGRERAEQEVLDRRLLGQQPAPPGQPAEQVERQREHLERDEHEQQVVRADEDHHAGQREGGQREELGLDPGGGERCAGRVGPPATTAAWATKAPPPTSTDFSASSSTDSSPSTSRRALQEERRPVDGERAGRGQLGRAGRQHHRDQRGGQAEQGHPGLDRPTGSPAARTPRRARRRRRRRARSASGTARRTRSTAPGCRPPRGCTGVTVRLRSPRLPAPSGPGRSARRPAWSASPRG